MSSSLRERIDHPVIDADGHTIEFMPQVAAYCREVAGSDVAQQFERSGCLDGLPLALEARANGGPGPAIRPPWWAVPSRNTLDRATAMFPRLLYDRLDEIGLDFAVLYPTHGLFALGLEEDEVRQAACRAFNLYHARLYGEFADRLAPVAIIPMNTPGEAVAELEHARTLGLKAVLLGGMSQRDLNGRRRLDFVGFDNAYDYDPVWAACERLGFAPAFHSSGMGWGSRASNKSYVYNHIGNFAAAQEAICRSLFLGGVTRRFPGLTFAFLEGGVGWACNLFSDLIGHWEKRNVDALRHYDPAMLDRVELERLFDRYAPKPFADKKGELDRALRILSNPNEDPATLDEFASLQIDRVEQIVELFVEPFHFGCEADDPINQFAFNRRGNPFGAELKALFSSDIGHWDVPDMSGVLAEAHELVEHELITPANFRDFVFGNAVSMYTAVNPGFFDGTVIATHLQESAS
ncbi:MAG: amidohydrolase family protein [Pseudomonadales bacterium]